MKTHIAFCLDESGSVSRIIRPLIDAYNNNVKEIRTAVLDEGQEASMTALAFGHSTLKHRALYKGVQVQTVQELDYNSLKPSGMTPLFDSVHRAIEILNELDDGKPDTSFVVSIVTDGEENASYNPGVPTVLREIQDKTGTDRWTFTFLVPNGCSQRFSTKYRIPQGNIQEWDKDSAEGTRKAFVDTGAAYKSFFQQKSAVGVGKTMSSRSFYANLTTETVRNVRTELSEITKQVQFISPSVECTIRDCIVNEGLEFIKGAAFYELIKPEKKVQPYKMVALRVKSSGKVYAGQEARAMLGIDVPNTVRVVPGDHGKFDIFIQSTSYTRKIPAGTRVMYWPKVGTQKK